MIRMVRSGLSESRLERLAERRQRSDTSRSSQGTGNPAAQARADRDAGTTQITWRQMIAAQNPARQDSAARTETDSTPGKSDPPANGRVWITPFGQMIENPGRAAKMEPAAAAQTAAPTTAAETPSPAPEPPANTPEAARQVLNEALRRSNIEPSSLNLKYEEYPVFYPGGSYTNKVFTLELSSGAKESYDINLMLKNPWLTAFEIGRFMGRRA